jgi:L-ribulose-5-phosphate 3-epimerase
LPVQIGINGRFFPANWRPALQEIAFASESGFRAIQFQGKETGLTEDDLGSTFTSVADALQTAKLTVVMEIVIRIDTNGLTAAGNTPLEILNANLPAITALPCRYVHWHLTPSMEMEQSAISALEHAVVPQLAKGVALAKRHNFIFAIEHNEPALLLFGTPESCMTALNHVPGLHFVWDFNHTIPDHLTGFTALIPLMSVLHISDTPLPTVNYHLPIGMGKVDFAAYFNLLHARGFSGPAILEIGGLPQSGGYGRDTDEALLDSLQKLLAVL